MNTLKLITNVERKNRTLLIMSKDTMIEQFDKVRPSSSNEHFKSFLKYYAWEELYQFLIIQTTYSYTLLSFSKNLEKVLFVVYLSVRSLKFLSKSAAAQTASATAQKSKRVSCARSQCSTRLYLLWTNVIHILLF